MIILQSGRELRPDDEYTDDVAKSFGNS